MDNEAKLNLMKKRVIGSFKWQEDIIIPFSKEFGCTTEDLEDLFMDLLDMSSLEALHGTLEIANHKCLLERLDADLRLPWYVYCVQKRFIVINLKIKWLMRLLMGNLMILL